jgi:anti-sigma B factor antagonist
MPRMSPEAFQILSRPGSSSNVQILNVRGAITYSSSAAFQDAVAAATSPRLIIDLSEVPSLDSLAVGALVRVFVSCQKSGRKLAFVGLNHRVRNVLQITGVEPLFDIYAVIAEAEAGLS